MLFLLGAKKEEAQKNGSIRSSDDSPNQIVNSYEPLRGHSRAPYTMQQRLQNYPCPLNFNTQGEKYQQNNIADGKTQSIVPYASFGNKNALLLPGPEYGGGMLSLSLMTGSHEQMGYHNIPLNLPSHGDSNKNSSFNVAAGLQGNNTHIGFPNLSTKNTFSSQKNYHPSLSHEPNSFFSNHQIRNNSFIFNCPSLSHGMSMNNFPSLNGNSKTRTVPPIQIQNLDSRSYKDSSCERVAKHLFGDRIREIDDNYASSSKKLRIISALPVRYEEMQSSKIDLLVFNKGKHVVSTAKIKSVAKKKVAEKNLDFLLHL
ncbi:hypothetical protein RJT34_11172 [Clitoria ternatea]|uniref:Uncharacterized protein n=1 Tax=Clitoria ternatea TaxID=43366 RepID=A0AAN9JLF6_CLITE